MILQDDYGYDVAINLQHIVSIEIGKNQDLYIITYSTGKEVKFQKNDNSDKVFKWLQAKMDTDLAPPVDIQKEVQAKMAVLNNIFTKMQK